MLQLVRTLYLKLIVPPPWLWLNDRCFFRRIGDRSHSFFLIELIRQLIRWLRVPRLTPVSLNIPTVLPWRYFIIACWLNQFQFSEALYWYAFGLRTWKQLSSRIPMNLSSSYHKYRRKVLPNRCIAAIELLYDKEKLLSMVPIPYNVEHLLLSPKWNNCISHSELPDWWLPALQDNGIILKPNRGSRSERVVLYRLAAQGVEQRLLFEPASFSITAIEDIRLADPTSIYQRWMKLFSTSEDALAMPYISHSSRLPESNISAVVRVITEYTPKDANPRFRCAWLEISSGSGLTAVFDLDGNMLLPVNTVSQSQMRLLADWSDALKNNCRQSFNMCFEGSILMHALLPHQIDQVAWDWIPSEVSPILLEGNANFGILVPQIIELNMHLC